MVMVAMSQVSSSPEFCFQSELVAAQTEICVGDALFVLEVMRLRAHATLTYKSGPIVLKVILNLLHLAHTLDCLLNIGKNPPWIS